MFLVGVGSTWSGFALERCCAFAIHADVSYMMCFRQVIAFNSTNDAGVGISNCE